MKRDANSSSSLRRDSKKVNHSGAGKYCAKNANEVNQNGKLSSLGCASSESERDRTFSLILGVPRLPLLPVVSPGKEVRPSSKQSVVTRGNVFVKKCMSHVHSIISFCVKHNHEKSR
jgi:hypothetical protein